MNNYNPEEQEKKRIKQLEKNNIPRGVHWGAFLGLTGVFLLILAVLGLHVLPGLAHRVDTLESQHARIIPCFDQAKELWNQAQNPLLVQSSDPNAALLRFQVQDAASMQYITCLQGKSLFADEKLQEYNGVIE